MTAERVPRQRPLPPRIYPPFPRRYRLLILPQAHSRLLGRCFACRPFLTDRQLTVSWPNPRQAFFHKPFLQAGTIRQNDYGHSAAITIKPCFLYIHDLVVTEATCALSSTIAPGLPFFWAVNAVKANLYRTALILEHCDGIAVADADDDARPRQSRAW